MKANDQPSDARRAEPGTIARKPRRLWLAGAIGMGLGVFGGSAYLWLGGDYWLAVPRWASILFYTGFFTGNWTYNHWHFQVGTAIRVGVITVGLTYALIAVLARVVWLALKRPSSSSHQDPEMKS